MDLSENHKNLSVDLFLMVSPRPMSFKKIISLVLHVIGVYTFFTLFGIYGERLTTTTYNGVKYEPGLFLLALQSLGGVVITIIVTSCIGVEKKIKHGSLLFQYICISVLGLVSNQLGLFSLKHLNYTTFIMAKSCKLVPVAFLDYLVYGKALSRRKLFSLVLVSLSIFSFSFFSRPEWGTKKFCAIGIFALFVTLLIDGITNVMQGNTLQKFKVPTFHMMYYINTFKLVISFVLILLTNDLKYNVGFINQAPGILFDMLLYSIFSVFGQIVSYSMVQSHGLLVFITVNLVRKMFSVLLSLAIFGHKINAIQALSVFGVLVFIVLEAFEPRKVEKVKEA